MKKILRSILPKNLIQDLSFFRDYSLFPEKYKSKYALQSFSQEGEDVLLKRIFDIRKKYRGFYIDVGAHHPYRYSNTYLFYLKGWSGINIDAMPNSMKAFNKVRARDINLEIPISDQKQVLTYYAFNETALNGFSKEISEKRDGQDHFKLLFTKDIQTATLEEILDQYLPKNQEIDFLTVDVEGLDFEVIRSINLDKYKPKVILAEILRNSLSNLDQNPMLGYLEEYGYSVLAKTVNTAFFIHKDFK
ncbi:FkbM family methyltransferase [Algoriphagus marincola]|uniref:FkbM family methyltransferase n=1 Tax=Algoriphagus marincola TaxID=264027 RepID=A0ABS7N1P6_9BACT|nr:FkbM family methyltransferase [Algoriphagus marincola]MBY5949911.1 FkbM family methyltransferase [Algoriphagus marincola]